MSKIYKVWKDADLTVIETEFDYDLHRYNIYHGPEYIGSVIPDDVDACAECRAALDKNGARVVLDWDDGAMHGVSIDADSEFYAYWHNDAEAVEEAAELYQAAPEEITLEDLYKWIDDGQCIEFDYDGAAYYIHINADGELVYNHSDGVTTIVKPVSQDAIAEWIHDEDPERFYSEFETLENPDFRQLLEELLEEVNAAIADIKAENE